MCNLHKTSAAEHQRIALSFAAEKERSYQLQFDSDGRFAILMRHAA
jgi:hypothetical protein